MQKLKAAYGKDYGAAVSVIEPGLEQSLSVVGFGAHAAYSPDQSITVSTSSKASTRPTSKKPVKRRAAKPKVTLALKAAASVTEQPAENVTERQTASIPARQAASIHAVEPQTTVSQQFVFAALEARPARAQKRLPEHIEHSHQKGVPCECCALDDAQFAAAHKALSAGYKRKQTKDTSERKVVDPAPLQCDLKPTEQQKLIARKLIASCAAVVALAVAIYIWSEERQHATASSLAPLSSKSFVTLDRAFSIEFLQSSIFFSGRTGAHVASVRRWQDNWREQLALLSGKDDNALWLKSIPQGFQAPDGTILYDSSCPEVKVIDSMFAVRDAAEKMYQVQGRYPNDISDLRASGFSISENLSQFRVDHEIGSNLITQNGETMFEHHLRSGQRFSSENACPPCSVSCVEIKSEPLISADLNSYGWRTKSFFIHGFDRAGNLINGFNGHGALLLSLKNGLRGKNTESEAFSRSIPSSVWIYSGDLPNRANLRFNCFVVILLLALSIGAIIMMRVQNCVMDENRTVKETVA